MSKLICGEYFLKKCTSFRPPELQRPYLRKKLLIVGHQMKTYLITSVRFLGVLIGFIGFLLQNIIWLLVGVFLTSIALAFLTGKLEETGVSLLKYNSHVILISNGFWWIWRYTVHLKEEKESQAKFEEEKERARREREAEEERARREMQAEEEQARRDRQAEEQRARRKREAEEQRARREREAEEEKRAIREAERLVIQKMLFPERSANSITKEKIASNGFLTNSEWDLRARAELIREYGVQRFMFPPKPSEEETLAQNLETTAFEVNLARSLKNSERVYSISPVVEYWIENSAKDWLQDCANNGRALPLRVSFEKMASDIGLPSFDVIGFDIALRNLFEVGVLDASGNGGHALPALRFVEEILDTTKFRNLVKEYKKEGIAIRVSVGSLDYTLSEPAIVFESIIDSDLEKSIANDKKY